MVQEVAGSTPVSHPKKNISSYLFVSNKIFISMRDKIIELREKGYTYQMIKDELGCSKSTISYHLGVNQKKMAYERVKKQRVLNPWLKKQENFLERYNEKNVTYNSKYFDREKLKQYLESIENCYLTGRKINTSDISSYEFDHIVPLSRGGDSSFENLGITTPEANRAKYNMTVEEFIELCKDVLCNFGYKVEKLEE